MGKAITFFFSFSITVSQSFIETPVSHAIDQSRGWRAEELGGTAGCLLSSSGRLPLLVVCPHQDAL